MNEVTFSELFKNQYEAFSNGRGLVELKNWSTITMTGEDRHSFLHNMCTNDIKRLSSGDDCEAFCTDVKGKIVAHVFVRAWEDRLELLTVPGQTETLIGHLDRYIIREDVTLTDSSEEFNWLLFGSEKPSIPGEFADILSQPFGQLPTTLLGVSKTELPDVLATIENSGLITCTYEVWKATRIESAIPLFGVDFDSTHLPQEINRDEQTISFNKGCYLGQETIARIDALGHVNQKSVLLQFDGEATPDVGVELILGEKSVGRVTSSCWSPQTGSPLALAMVRRGANDLNTQLESSCGQATVVTPLSQAD